MASSRLVLTARGAGGLLGALIVLVLAFYTINILLFAVAVFLLAFMLAALFAFVRATRGFGPDAFEAQRVESSSFVSVGGHAFVSVRVSSQLEGAFYTESSIPIPSASRSSMGTRGSSPGGTGESP